LIQYWIPRSPFHSQIVSMAFHGLFSPIKADAVDEQEQQQQQQQSNRGPEEGEDGFNDGHADDGPDNRHRVRAPPSPVWVREDDGSMELVERTPANVLLWDLDDPFPHEHKGDDTASDGHDSVETDDDNNVVKVAEPMEPGIAAIYLGKLMTKYRRYRFRELTVSLDEDDLLGDPEDLPADFRRFVRGLEAYGRIRELHLTRFNFGRDPPDDVRGADEDGQAGGGGLAGREELGADLSQLVGDASLEDFFGTVLCTHISLDTIAFTESTIPTRYWKLFTENVLTRASPLLHLSLVSTPLTMPDCQLLKWMLQRKARLDGLTLEYCGLGADEWRAVCEGLAESGGAVDVVTLSENGITVGPDTLLPLLRAPSGVKDLHVGAPSWAEGAFEGFVKALRTNEILRDVQLEHYHQFSTHLSLVEELLTTYNCTLETFASHPLEDDPQGRIDALLERNQPIRALGTPSSATSFRRYHISRKSVWPRVVAEYGRLPTQLYRFLREGNLEGFARQVEEAAAESAAVRQVEESAAESAAARSDRLRRRRQKKKRRRRLLSR
jgi:hypothetical protein